MNFKQINDFKSSILIQELEVFAHHGIYNEEKNGQIFVINLELKLDLENTFNFDSIDYTVDYDMLCGFIKDVFTKHKFNLLETATNFLIEQILVQFPQIVSVTAETYKKNVILKSNVKIKFAKIKLTRSLHTAFLGLGSNIENKLNHINNAIEIIKKTHGVILAQTSKIKQTKAYGRQMADFLNCVVKIKTFLNPFELLKLCQHVEKQLNRVRTIKWGPRTIDVDILFFDHIHLDLEHLTIPHPDLENRNFVLEPMLELAPNFVHPTKLKSIKELYHSLNKENINAVKQT